MAQYGRRMRMRRMYDGDEDGSDAAVVQHGYSSPAPKLPAAAGEPQPLHSLQKNPSASPPHDMQYYHTGHDVPHPPTRGLSVSAEVTQLQDTLADVTRRLKALEDRAVMAETASRRSAIDSDRMRERMMEFEGQTQQALVELTKGADRTFHRVEQTQRDVESAKDWCHKLLTTHVAQVEQTLRGDVAAQMGDVTRRLVDSHGTLAAQQAQLEQGLRGAQDAARAAQRGLQDRIDAVAEVVENGISEAAKRSDALETHFHEALEMGLGRERAARECEVLDRDRLIQQSQANTLQIVEREIGAEVKKTSEFAETSLQRMDAIERLLKAEIRNRMDLASSYDKVVDDMRKMERTTLASVTTLETAIQERFTELSHTLQQQATTHRDALAAAAESQKKLIGQLAIASQKELADTKAYMVKKCEMCEKGVADLTARQHETVLRVDEVERQATETRHSQDREGKEHRSELTRAVNKWEEELGRTRLEAEEFCLKQVQACARDGTGREGILKDQLQAEVKRVQDTLQATLRSHEKTHNDLKRTIADSSADYLRELHSNIDKVATLVQKTDEISKLHMERNAEVSKEMNELRVLNNNVQGDVTELRGMVKKEVEAVTVRTEHQHTSAQAALAEVRREMAQVSETVGEHRLANGKTFQKINEQLLGLQDFHDTQQQNNTKVRSLMSTHETENSQLRDALQDARRHQEHDFEDFKTKTQAEFRAIAQHTAQHEAEAQRLAEMIDALSSDALAAGDRNAGSTTKLVGELDAMAERTEALEGVLERVQGDLLALQQDRIKNEADTALLLGLIDGMKDEAAESGDKASGAAKSLLKEVEGLRERTARAEEQLAEITDKQQTLQRTLAQRRTSEDYERELEAMKNRCVGTIQHRELKQEVEEITASFTAHRTTQDTHTKRIDTLHEKLCNIDVFVQERVAEMQKEQQQKHKSYESDMARLRVETQHSMESVAGETRKSVHMDDVRQELLKVKAESVSREELDVIAKKLMNVDEAQQSLATKEKERTEGDGAWDEWKVAVTQDVSGQRGVLASMFVAVEAAAREQVACEAAMRFRSLVLEFDVRELDDRVRADFEAYEKLLEYHQREADIMAQRRTSRRQSGVEQEESA